MKKLYFLFILFSLTLNINAQIPTDSLVGYWPFNGNANDVSGNGNDGTVNGAILTIDRFGNENSAYSFDGVDDFISISPSPTLRTDQMDSITISIWGKPESFDDKNRFINIANTTENVNYDLSILSNKIWFQNYYHVPPHISMHDTGDVVLNKWYHILVTINVII